MPADTETLNGMGRKRFIRQAVSLVLALALLLAPCAILSVASSQALASETSHAMHAGHADGSHSAHGDCHDPLSPDQGGCATDCHSWITAPPFVELQAPDRDDKATPSFAPLFAAGPTIDLALDAAHRATVPPNFTLQSHGRGAPVFALTERYRL